jgi:hypothetical protein
MKPDSAVSKAYTVTYTLPHCPLLKFFIIIAKLADARESKSRVRKAYRFNSGPGHHFNCSVNPCQH